MPIYEYFCKKCEQQNDLLLPIGHLIPVCSDCNVEMTRKVSTVSFHLKGSGWSRDGYVGAGRKKQGEALKLATEEAKNDLYDTMDSLDKKSRLP